MRIIQWTQLACGLLLAMPSSPAEEHRWAGRTFSDQEWRIHEELATLPFHGVFDDLRFEVSGGAVTLSGYVMREPVKANAERAVKRVDGVNSVTNRIEVLPSSKADDSIRMRVYRAIYENRQLEKYGTRGFPQIQIVVRNGAVTLEGFVDSETDRKLAYHQASRVARAIQTNLRVAPLE